jgi:hypothetical protein
MLAMCISRAPVLLCVFPKAYRSLKHAVFDCAELLDDAGEVVPGVQKDLKILGETYSRLLLVRCALRDGVGVREGHQSFYLLVCIQQLSSHAPVYSRSFHIALQDVKQLLDADDKDAWPSVSGIWKRTLSNRRGGH